MVDDATQRQIDAARPDRSTWLSANAGSGKTKVLTDRVARLLLAGTDPQNILCLTYTKAAASEMQNRLFDRLGEWAMLPDDILETRLTDLGIDGPITPERLREARRLFAVAIETPGGLKIQTIHSFCSALLRRFPLEAGVSPQFTEMEDRAAALLRAEVVEKIANGPDAQALYDLAEHYTGEDLESLTQEIVGKRDRLSNPVSEADLSALFGLRPEESAQSLVTSVFLGGEAQLMADLLPILTAGSTNDAKAAVKLTMADIPSLQALPILEDVFLTGSSAKSPFSAKIGSFPTKALREANPGLTDALNALMVRVEEARDTRLALQARETARILHRFTGIFLPAYAAAKEARGMLDFDDLILRSRDLLDDPKVADWVLFKLDGGIDHILVDEAQDTSPVQWTLIERLSQEFTSGTGARADRQRTIFVVGDKKQSIYSFQGADPEGFDRMKEDFRTKLEVTDAPLQDMEMEFSFRSAQTILSLVDETFRGLDSSGFTQREKHKAFHDAMPGRVDLWPPIEKEDAEEPPEWYDPVDIKAPGDPATRLAAQIARNIKEMLGTPLPSKEGNAARAITEGDILILVQRRSGLFHEIIRACKSEGLNVAGADRLRVGAELAVRDVAALLSFLATPEDSLSLATALRSPLFGWSEAQLFDLAHDRPHRYLWQTLRERAAEYPETLAVVNDLRRAADYLRPYDMIERILTRHQGRARLLSRLGPEAEDGIDALLSQAMAYERNAIDSLTGFLVWMETDDLEIKRQLDNAGNRIRVMTAHAAKGLESAIVILPDSAKRDLRVDAKLIGAGDTALWRPRKDDLPTALQAIDTAERDAQWAERDRLLYVAMTRAEQWLIVAAAGDLDKEGRDWYSKVQGGMLRSDAVEHVFDGGQGLRLQSGNWAGTEPVSAPVDLTITPSLPAFFQDHAKPAMRATETLAPSDLGGDKALPGEAGLDEDAAKRRGRQVHRLLEMLPQRDQTDWAGTAESLLAHGPDAATGQELALLLAEAEHVLAQEPLRFLFSPQALAEVPVSANLDALGGRRIHGAIDRLIVTPEKILAVDFKTNAVVPNAPADVPSGLLRQMGAYAHALQQIYPGRSIETALLWTRTATLMPLPHDLVTQALADTHIA
ncbi:MULTISPECIES: double-strand break repair helicase AddA [Roseovarius]|uniref:double-strand break repair helicase AddA n=1 Tax=Roseovarius TaxID=74030 RepID=UPI00273E1844|nr:MULTISPECIES: double-strand break repair helicase AddA [unclassified Roseovarius]